MEDKQKILTDLYAIRAGMSVISQKKDEIVGAQRRSNNELSSIQSEIERNHIAPKNYNEAAEPKCPFCGAQLNKGDDKCPICGAVISGNSDENISSDNSYENVAYDYEYYKHTPYTEPVIARMKKALPKIKRGDNAGKLLKGFLISVFVLFLLGTLTCAALWIMGYLKIVNPKIAEYMTFIFWIVLLLTVGAGKLMTMFSGSRKHYEQQLEKLRKIKIYNELAEKHEKNCVAIIPPSLALCKTLTLDMQKNFTSIDVRDWKYVDTLIFYFETGRADSVKEALQHLDKEIQTKEIISTIKQSAEYICNTIKTCTRQITERLDRISSQLSSIAFSQSIMIQQQTLQTALMAKMARSSESLASDVNYMAERARYNY